METTDGPGLSLFVREVPIEPTSGGHATERADDTSKAAQAPSDADGEGRGGDGT
ncbi:MAG: hypothetical protein M0Z69_10530 [Actinomycetota bacterium]|nr:hypothetical protein [Actinomycetota bacterium]